MPCGCKPKRMSGTRLFAACRKSGVPEGGWHNGLLGTAAFLRLQGDFVRAKRIAQLRGIRSITPYLKAKMKELVEIIIRDVYERKDRRGEVIRKELEFAVNPVGDEQLWADAINSAMADYGVEATVDMIPRLQSVASEVYGRTTILLGGQAAANASNLVLASIRDMAAQVTSINETTRRQLVTIMRQGISEGDSVSGVALRLRDSLPERLWPRIPTIARTEMGRAVDRGSALAMEQQGSVKTVDVIGCQAVEPGIPTYHGRPTCNIVGVPVHDAKNLQFHINHTGCIVPGSFFDDAPDAPPVSEPNVVLPKEDAPVFLPPAPAPTPEVLVRPAVPAAPGERIPAPIPAMSDDLIARLTALGKTKVTPESLGLRREEVPVGGRTENMVRINPAELVIGRDHLDPRRILALNNTLPGGLIKETGVTKIVTTRSRKTGNLVVSGDGNHRVAFLQLVNYGEHIPVLAIEPA